MVSLGKVIFIIYPTFLTELGHQKGWSSKQKLFYFFGWGVGGLGRVDDLILIIFCLVNALISQQFERKIYSNTYIDYL